MQFDIFIGKFANFKHNRTQNVLSSNNEVRGQFHNFRSGLSRQECIDKLKFLYGDEAPSYSTLKNWFNEFNPG